MIVLQNTTQPCTITPRQIKGIEARKEERKIPNKIETIKLNQFKDKRTKTSHLQV